MRERWLFRAIFVLLLLLVSAFATDKPTTPTLCTPENRGSCNCFGKDIKTYVFWPGAYQRCIYTFIPEGNASPVPVLIHIDGYGEGKPGPDSDVVTASKYYGFAVFSLGSTGPKDGAGGFGLQFPNDGVVNPNNPTPCSSKDSRDYDYIKGALDLIDSLSALDSSKVFFEGFSQNSMYAAYASVCFADRVAGLWQGGSGLAKAFHTPITPGLQGQCTASDFKTHGNSCCDDNFCTDCSWWPIYPRTCNDNKLIDCLATYTDDFLCGSDWYMFNAMVAEGHDARMLSFSPTNDLGGHRNPANEYAWIVGCLGITESCSTLCETSFLECTGNRDPSEYERCEEELKGGRLMHCISGCAPTLEMLEMSERPLLSLSKGKFGAQTSLPITTTPGKPNCEKKFGSFDEINQGQCRPPSDIESPPFDEIKSCDNTPSPTPIANSPTSAPTSMESPTVAPAPVCTSAGSNCYRHKKWGGCDHDVCKSLVCNDIPQCCENIFSGWTGVCKKKARQTCIPCPCTEKISDTFLFKLKIIDGEPVPVSKTCNWLSKKSTKKRKKICKSSDTFGDNDPARIVCPNTCKINRCPS